MSQQARTTTGGSRSTGDAIVSEFAEQNDYLSSREKAQELFIEHIDIIEYTFENCRCRENFSLHRNASVESGTRTVRECRRLSESAIHPDDRYDWAHVPEYPEEKDQPLFEDQGRTLCGSCMGNKVESCHCGNGRVECSECRGRNRVRCSCDDGRVTCPKCGGDGEVRCCPEDDTCFRCDWNGMRPCDNEGCRYGKVPCSQPNCNNGYVPCSCKYDGEVDCSNCNGTGEVDCSHCHGVGERVSGNFGTLSFTVQTENTQVASKKGMPTSDVAKQRPDSGAAYDYTELIDNQDVTDGVVKHGSREWSVPCHRVRYKYEGEIFTILKLGDEFQASSLPEIAYKAERDTYHRSIYTYVATVTGILGYIAFVDSNPTSWPVSILLAGFLGLATGLINGNARDLERPIPEIKPITLVGTMVPATVISMIAAPIILNQPAGGPGWLFGDSAMLWTTVLTLLFVVTAHVGSVTLIAPKGTHDDGGDDAIEFIGPLLCAILGGGAIGAVYAPFHDTSFLGVVGIWLLGGIVSIVIVLLPDPDDNDDE